MLRNLINPPVDNGPVVVPGVKNRLHSHFQLFKWLLREGFFNFFIYDFFICFHQTCQLLSIQFGVQLDAGPFFQLAERSLKVMMGNSQNHIAKHLDKAAVTVKGKPAVARNFSKGFNSGVVEAKIEDGVHHPGH